MYEQGSDFIGHEFRKYLIEREYGILAKKSTSGNPNYNTILEWIHSVIGTLIWTYNIEDTYIDKDDPWSGISEAKAFSVHSTKIV